MEWTYLVISGAVAGVRETDCVEYQLMAILEFCRQASACEAVRRPALDLEETKVNN